MNHDPYIAFLNVLDDIGLLDNIDTEQRAEMLESARNVGKPEMLLYAIPNMVYGFDCETVWVPTIGETYKRLVRDLSAISRGQFHPAHLSFSLTPEEEGLLDWREVNLRFTFSFDFAGKRYEHHLKYLSDYIDVSFIDTLNLAVAEAGQEGRYCWIDTNDQMVVVIFLARRQFAALKEFEVTGLKQWQEIYIDLSGSV